MRRGVLALTTAAVLVSGAPAQALFQAEGVDLGGVFGQAIASATALTGGTMELDLQVEADPEAAVVAHLIEPGGSQETMPLQSRGSGAFGIRTEVRKTDYLVVFEAIEGSLASQSPPVRLTELGVEPALVGVLTVAPEDAEDFSDATRQWGWAGLALAAAALTVLALWALPDRLRRARAAAAADSSGTTSEVGSKEASGPGPSGTPGPGEEVEEGP